MGIREEYLKKDFEAMKKFRSTVLSWKPLGNSIPPEEYQVTYNLRSIVGFHVNGEPKYHKRFVVKIKFPISYPRQLPTVYFQKDQQPHPHHPNIFVTGQVCLTGDDYDPQLNESLRLDRVCEMVGEIIAFQAVNLNDVARLSPILEKWVQENLDFVGKTTKVDNPIDRRRIRDIDDPRILLGS